MIGTDVEWSEGSQLPSETHLDTRKLATLLLSWTATTLALVADLEPPDTSERRHRILALAGRCRTLGLEIVAEQA